MSTLLNKQIVTMLLLLLLGVFLDAGPDGLWVGRARAADKCDTLCHLRLYNKECASGLFPGQCYRFSRPTCYMCSPFTGNQRCLKSPASEGTNCSPASDPNDTNNMYLPTSCNEECTCGTGTYTSWVEASNWMGGSGSSVSIRYYSCTN